MVVLSYFIGPRPMDLVFTPAEVLAVFDGGVHHRRDRQADGETNWVEGLILLAVYVILAHLFLFPAGRSVRRRWNGTTFPIPKTKLMALDSRYR